MHACMPVERVETVARVVAVGVWIIGTSSNASRRMIASHRIPACACDPTMHSGHEAEPAHRLQHREQRAQRLLPACLATFMSAFVAAVVTAINTGIDPGLAGRWLLAWLIAWPAAVLAAYVFRSLAWRLARLLAR